MVMNEPSGAPSGLPIGGPGTIMACPGIATAAGYRNLLCRVQESPGKTP
jgi:hypothetical protein